MANQKSVSALIIGAGFSGLGVAIKLRENGIDDIIILERAAAIGGTWRDNNYPGAACDVPSHLYSYSFAQNPQWSCAFSSSAEILHYMQQVAQRFQLNSIIKFNHNVTALAFDEDKGEWVVTTENGAIFHAKAVVMAQGPLSNASFPAIAGIEQYAGHKIHSARWDHQYDFKNKRVAVIGTGASAVQIIPELVKQVSKLTVFQRTPNWVLPRLNFRTPKAIQTLFSEFSVTQQALRSALFWAFESAALGIVWTTPVSTVLEKLSKSYLRQQIKDPWLRRQLTPDYRIGCKRVLQTSDYYSALQQKNCELISWPIVKLTEKGIVTAEGLEHQFDCIVFATGFEVTKSGTPFPISGLNGRKLQEEWKTSAQAYKSANVSGFPNLFFMLGPNSGPGHNSALVYIEAQIAYAVKGIQKIVKDNIKILDVTAAAQAKYNKLIQTRLNKTSWSSGCKSWYLTEDGFNATMYPGFATQYQHQMGHFDLKDYAVVRG